MSSYQDATGARCTQLLLTYKLQDKFCVTEYYEQTQLALTAAQPGAGTFIIGGLIQTFIRTKYF